MLQVPTQKQLEEKLDAADNPKEKRKIQSNYDSQYKAVIAEASLYNVEKVKYLAWEPELTVKGFPKFNPDNTLKGKYICQYENEKGILIPVAVPND